MPPTGSPTATYRLQLRREFGFRDAAAVVPYLASLGVSHVYCSPVLAATPGSAHGYDVVDHSRLSPELGGDEAWAELVAACREHGLGIVVDVVPNHMAIPTPESLNPVLWDVLREGRASSYADWFDVDRDSQDGVLPRDWSCAGTTGYDAVAAISAVLADASGEKPLTETYVSVTGEEPDFDAVVATAKRLVVDGLFPAEIHRLVRDLRRSALVQGS